MIGFSADGYLASLLGLSSNNNIASFCPGGKKPSFKISTVLYFYGPSVLTMLAGNKDTSANNEQNPALILLGAGLLKRPDLAKIASPVTYVDKNYRHF